MKIYNVLVFPGGTEIGLELQKALCYCKDIQLYSAGVDVSNHAPYVFSQHFIIPSIHSIEWIDRLNQVITDNNIDYVFPAYDDIIVALVQNAEKIKARIVTSPLKTCLITRSKSQSYHFLTKAIPVPKIYKNSDEIEQYPVFVKPDKGQGSQDTHIVHSKADLAHLHTKSHEYIVTEYLPGEEYTVDCFSHRNLGLLFCRGRQRIRTRNGISMNSCSAKHDNHIFVEYAKKILEKLTFHGAWFFQLKKDIHGTYKLLEIAPRIAGAMSFHRIQGVNFPLLSIYEQEGIPLEIITNKVDVQLDRALLNRYKHNLQYSVIYVDLDDTLIFKNKINLNLIHFLYQCINNNKRIVLLTRNSGNIQDILLKHRIKEIFDDIIQVDLLANKADYIFESDAIFIDDSFRERKLVKNKLGICTFDCSMIEMLLDDRC